jgi:hypothetical protein
MNWLGRLLKQGNPEGNRDYQPLSQAAEDSFPASNTERDPSHGGTRPPYRGTTGHLDETQFIPVHQFGIELHPDTAALLENDDALARAFGGNSQSACERLHARLNQADHCV